MITEDYVSYEVARLLQEKGFDEVCFACYEYFISGVTLYQGWQFEYKGESVRNTDERVKCPTSQMAMKWLREVHHIFIYIEPFITTSGLQGYKPYCTKIGEEFMWINPLNTSSDIYEEAVEATIKYCLEKLI